MTGKEFAEALRRTASFFEPESSVDGIDIRIADSIRIVTDSTVAQRVRRHRAQTKHPDDPLQPALQPALQDCVTEPVTEAAEAEACPPPHPLPVLSNSASPGIVESFPDPEILPSESSDLDLTGSARVQSSVTQPRNKTAAKAKRNAKPVPFPEGYDPPAELVTALAAKHEATPDQIRRAVPEIAWYWQHGKGRGTKRALDGWNQTVANRIAQLAKDGGLYTERPSGIQRTNGSSTPRHAQTASTAILAWVDRETAKENER